MTFHEHLARRRKALGLSQEELAAKIGVSRQAVSKWETGDSTPDLNRLLALAEALDTSLDTLCGREAAEPPAAAAPAESDVPPKKHPWLLPAPCGFLAACLLSGGLWVWTQRNMVPAEEAAAMSTLPDTFTVSGVRFSSVSDYTVAYQFTPSVSGDAISIRLPSRTRRARHPPLTRHAAAASVPEPPHWRAGGSAIPSRSPSAMAPAAAVRRWQRT